MADYKKIKVLLPGMPQNEGVVLSIIEEITMTPRMRALQKKGRFEHFSVFKEFLLIIEAATICYFRANYFSAYLTLVPVIEGVILRWMGFSGNGNKPEFDKIRRFFANSHMRQPCPGNPLFHEVFAKACDKIVNEHLFKPSEIGHAYSNFNRHLAAHLLNNSQFATKENCIRLFLLLDTMSELYLYETFCNDPRFNLSGEQIQLEYLTYNGVLMERATANTAEQILLSN